MWRGGVSRVNEAMPQVVRAFDQVEALATSLNDAVPQMMRAFDQVEALTTSLNDTMPQVTPLLDEAGTFVQNLNTTMPRVGPTLDQLVAMAGNMNTALVQIGYLLDRTNSLLETADALIEGIESTYQDGVLGSTGRVVTKARSASRDLLDKGPSFLRAQDDFQAGW